MNFLIVEDEHDVCLAMVYRVRVLRQNPNDEIEYALSSEAALEIIKRRTIDLLITDIRLSGMNGLDLIEQCLRIRPRMKSIVVTAYDDFSYAQRAVRLGCVDFLLKPYTKQELAEAINRSISNKIEETPQIDNSLKIDWVKGYVAQHLNDNIDMAVIADALHLSYAYFSRRFKDEMGLSFSDYVQQVRIEEACRLLKAGMNVGETAGKVGYSNTYAFTRAFTRFMKQAPTQWLKDVKKGN